MAEMLFLVLVALGTVQSQLRLGEELNETRHRLMQNLGWKVKTLLQDVEQTQGHNWVAQKVLLLPSFQQWCFWPSVLGAIALLLLLWLCCRRTTHKPGSSYQQGRHGKPNEEEEDEQEAAEDYFDIWADIRYLGRYLLHCMREWSFSTFIFCEGALILLQRRENTRKRSPQQGSPRRPSKEWEDEEAGDELDADSDDECNPGRYVVDSIQWPMLPVADKCKLAEELVDHLLTACRRLSSNTFKPRLQPAIGLGCGYEHRGSWDDNVLYRLLVPLQPPPGHTFCLELSPDKETLTRDSCLRVQLQCMCMREQLVGDMLCFVHHSEHELESQGPSLLNTLCTNSYLDIQKTACWFQQLVKAAWKLLPFSHSCQLTVLPTTRSCKIKLTAGLKVLIIEMTFGVLLDNAGSFLSLE